MVKLGFSLQAKYDCPLSRMVQLLHEAGFSAVSPIWSPELPLEELADCLQEHAMAIQSLHAPRGGLAGLWNARDPASPQAEQRILSCIDACARYGIPVMAMHGWQGLAYIFPETPLDYSVFDRIVDRAEEKQVSIAFENLEGEEYLQALMTRYCDRTHVGFCWDSGHDHCYPHKTDFLKAYGERLIMTHLNDNQGVRDPDGVPSGKDDLHFLPGDGNICWSDAIGRLKDTPRQTILNFEVKKRAASTAPGDLLYDGLTLEEFFCLAGQRAGKIAALYEATMDL